MAGRALPDRFGCEARRPRCGPSLNTVGALLPGQEAPEAVPTTTTTSVVEAPADDAVSDDGADGPAVDPSTAEDDPEARLDTAEFSPELREGADVGDAGRSSPITGTYWAGLAVAAVATAGRPDP